MITKTKVKSDQSEEKEQAPIRTSLENESIYLLATAEQTKEEMSLYYTAMLDDPDAEADAKARADSYRRTGQNLARALGITYSISDELTARAGDLRRQNTKRPLIATPPANAAIDHSELQSTHFAKGRNLYKMLLICFIGSLFGVLIELAWCLLKNGYLESRSGLVWGPFNLLYGVGAVALTLFLYPLRNHTPAISFAGGFVVGSVLEYLCSLGQELLLGSTSWDYSAKPFNIGGRICLLYSLFWGLLGVIWIKDLYPRLAKHILKIPNRVGKIATLCLTAFLVLNSAVSLIAVTRWSERVKGDVADNAFEQFIDERFPDERMEQIYANMKFNTD